LPRSSTQLENDPCPLADKCLVTAIEVDLQIVADAGTTDVSKLDALKFLGHWVADVHKPMHVSFKDDRGGNRIKESGPCERNLHAVWDSCIVETKLGRDVSLRLPCALATCTIRRWVVNDVGTCDWLDYFKRYQREAREQGRGL